MKLASFKNTDGVVEIASALLETGRVDGMGSHLVCAIAEEVMPKIRERGLPLQGGRGEDFYLTEADLDQTVDILRKQLDI